MHVLPPYGHAPQKMYVLQVWSCSVALAIYSTSKGNEAQISRLFIMSFMFRKHASVRGVTFMLHFLVTVVLILNSLLFLRMHQSPLKMMYKTVRFWPPWQPSKCHPSSASKPMAKNLSGEFNQCGGSADRPCTLAPH